VQKYNGKMEINELRTFKISITLERAEVNSVSRKVIPKITDTFRKHRSNMFRNRLNLWTSAYHQTLRKEIELLY